MVIKLKISSFLILVIFISTLLGGVLLASQMKDGKMFRGLSAAIIQPVLAEEMYPMFLCPCCGKPLDKNEICCGMAEERIKYVDSIVKPGVSKDEIILAYVKKYGLSSFADQNLAKEFKERIASQAPTDRPVITLSPASFDFGDVSQKKGTVSTVFELRNEGEKDLIINKLETSCGCTTAAIIFEGKEGPKFGMPGHGLNENAGDWQAVIPAGGQAQLKVYYDPNVHKDFRGAATREISVFSNDPIDFEKKVQVDLTQID
ncbi:MAG: DUF1573 domain-containing protein [bacterium]|nr:DUF1573 domain-containing protein [bacterium]